MKLGALMRRLVREPGKTRRLRHHNAQNSRGFLASLRIVGYGRKKFIGPRKVVGRGIGATRPRPRSCVALAEGCRDPDEPDNSPNARNKDPPY